MARKLVNGQVGYIEIPAIDIQRSADFYVKVFGWRITKRQDGSTAFEDTTGALTGTWVVGRPPATEPGLLVFILVDNVAATIDAIIRKVGTSCDQSANKRLRSDGSTIPPGMSSGSFRHLMSEREI